MISPRDAFIRQVKSYGLIRSQKEITQELIEKYIDPKSSEVSETFKYTKANQMITGRIYTFQYDPLYKDKLDYYDTQPIILSLKQYNANTTNNDIEMGINLNFLPPEVRIGLLEVFFRAFRRQITANNIKEAQNNTDFEPITLDDYEFLKKLFNMVAGVGFQFSIRQYIKARIKNARMFKYADWYKLGFVMPETILGKPMTEIYKLYHVESTTKYLIDNNNADKKE